MSDHEKAKKSKPLTPEEAARLLRELADKLESGTLEVGDHGTVPAGNLKVKVSGKSKDGSASLSLKFQWKHAGAGKTEEPPPRKKKTKPGAAGIPSYKSIKKRISSTFKLIRARLRAGCLPDAELARQFDEDAERMLHYPEKGEQAEIIAFRELSASFAAAVKAGDLDTAGKAAAALAAAEKSCHKRYK